MFAVFGPERKPWLLSVFRVMLLGLGWAFLTHRQKRGREWERTGVPAAVRRCLPYTEVGLGERREPQSQKCLLRNMEISYFPQKVVS